MQKRLISINISKQYLNLYINILLYNNTIKYTIIINKYYNIFKSNLNTYPIVIFQIFYALYINYIQLIYMYIIYTYAIKKLLINKGGTFFNIVILI